MKSIEQLRAEYEAAKEREQVAEHAPFIGLIERLEAELAEATKDRRRHFHAAADMERQLAEARAALREITCTLHLGTARRIADRALAKEQSDE